MKTDYTKMWRERLDVCAAGFLEKLEHASICETLYLNEGGHYHLKCNGSLTTLSVSQAHEWLSRNRYIVPNQNEPIPVLH